MKPAPLTKIATLVLFPAAMLSAGASPGLVLPLNEARVTAPMTLKDGVLHQPERTDLPAGGRAEITVTIPQAGDYVLRALVDAPLPDADSFYLNFDAPPEDPGMIWDIVETQGFEERLVSLRGLGDRLDNEFTPKVFTLTAGEHRLILVAREPAKLKGLVLVPHVKPAANTVAALRQALEDANRRQRQRLHKLPYPPPDERVVRQIYRQSDDEQEEVFAAGVKLAEAEPRSANGVALLNWVLQEMRSSYLPSGPRAIALLEQQYAASPDIGGTVALFAHYLPDPRQAMYPGTVALFQSVRAQNPDRVVQGQAALGFAYVAKQEFMFAEQGKDSEVAEVAHRKAVQAFVVVEKDYGDCRNLLEGSSRATLGAVAEDELHELRDLRLGMPAPEITDVDLAGAPLKLSDHRGKAVLLVFWASWCGPCMQAIPHEKELAERFKGRPFVIVGVNGDSRTQEALKAVEETGVSWRSFWDGADSHISDAWNVRGWPTVYAIDHQGIIRHRYPSDEQLAALVAEAEPRKSPASQKQ